MRAEPAEEDFGDAFFPRFPETSCKEKEDSTVYTKRDTQDLPW